MAELERFGVSMEKPLLEKFDRLNSKRGYRTRSEAIRDLVRKELAIKEWEDPKRDVVGTVTLVYSHHEHNLADALSELQHMYHRDIVSTTHVHLDEENCLEVVIVRGKSARARRIADTLLSTRGVKHGGAVATTTGESLS